MRIGLRWLRESLTQGCILVQVNALRPVQDVRVTHIGCSRAYKQGERGRVPKSLRSLQEKQTSDTVTF
jgi:hypothetical protein